jgi:hypothetical protein
VSIVGGKSLVAFVVRGLRVDVVGFLVIVHLLVLKKRIKRRKIGSIDFHRRRSGKLLLGGNDFQDVVGFDRFARGQEPPQYLIDKIKPFVFGGIQ